MERIYTADVVVCGAGTSGTVAAIAAADSGLSVLLIEQFGSSGGSAANSLVTPMMHTGIVGNPMCSYISDEINRRMVELGAATGNGDSWFDPLVLSVVLEEMLTERNVKILYHTTITGVTLEGRRIEEIKAITKSGSIVLKADYFIDATGDADVLMLSGLPTLHGNETDGKNQPVSLRYLLGGVDLQLFWNFIRRQVDPQSAFTDAPVCFEAAVTATNHKKWPLKDVFLKAIDNGDLLIEDMTYWQVFTVPGRKDALAFNCPEFFDLHDADDTENLTYVQLEGKKAILRQLKFYKKYFDGFSDAYIAQIASMVGVRESRRAVTDHIMTAEECYVHQKFDDAICRSNYPVDIHGRQLNTYAMEARRDPDRPYYEIPLRSLIVKDTDNLLVAGRNVGAEFTAQSSIRVMPACRAMGEAAGIACAAAKEMKAKTLHEVNGAHVRAEMMKRGARFD